MQKENENICKKAVANKMHLPEKHNIWIEKKALNYECFFFVTI